MLGAVQSLMPLMDGLFINNVAGTLVASSVTYSEPVINMMTSFAQGLSVAAMAILGQLNGRGNFEESKRTATQIVVAGSILGLLSAPLLLLAGFVISRKVNPQIAHNVFLYTSLYSLVLPFSFMESIYNGIKNANGKPEAPFVRMVIMLVLKILFNIVFIYWLRMGIVGCVLSSLVANVLITFWMFYELFVKDSPDRLELRRFHFNVPIVKELGKIGFPAMLKLLLAQPRLLPHQQRVAEVRPPGAERAGHREQHHGRLLQPPRRLQLGGDDDGQHERRGGRLEEGQALLPRRLRHQLSHGPRGPGDRRPAFLPPHPAVHARRRSPRDSGPGPPYLHLLGGRVRTVHDRPGSLHRPRAHQGPARARGAAIWLLRYLFILATEKALGYDAIFWGNLFSNYAAAVLAVILISRVKWVSASRPRRCRWK